ncbi:MAG: DNA-binding response regulator [Planctomycetota bacterium]|nr:MAG: DNA-binding response regulator [Planctomycetota bacterium]
MARVKKDRILVVEDEPRIAHWVTSFFTRAGYEAESVHDGALGLERILNESPDLVILDRMLPGMDGLEVLIRVRKVSSVPVILLTALGKDEERIEGLRHGADDYQCKPFNPEELVARAEAILRRVRDENCATLEASGITLNFSNRTCLARGMEVELTRVQFDILALLMKRPGQVFSRRDLVDAAFDRDFQGYDRAVDVQIRRLRTRVEIDSSHPQLIHTVHGVGYRFNEHRE